MQGFYQITIAACLILGGSACGGSEVPAKHLADAEASIRAAEEVGAGSIPEAALQLKMANDRLKRAQALRADGENEDAVKMYEEARVTAELAVLLARKEDAEARALEAEKQAAQHQQGGAKGGAGPNAQ